MPLFGPHRTYDWNFLRGFVLPSRSRDNHQSAGIDSRLAASAVTSSTVELEGLAVNKKLTIWADSFGLARPPRIVGRQQWNCLSSQHSASETSASGESCTSFRCDQKHVQGTVLLHVVIDIEGNVKQVDVLSGPPDLTTAATHAVKQWRYQPTLLDGDPVEVDTTVSVSFALGG